MAHTIQERRKLLARVNRIEGQIKSIRTALEEERECATVLQQIAACRGAINSLLVEIVDGEIRYHVLSKAAKVDSREARAAEDLVEIPSPLHQVAAANTSLLHPPGVSHLCYSPELWPLATFRSAQLGCASSHSRHPALRSFARSAPNANWSPLRGGCADVSPVRGLPAIGDCWRNDSIEKIARLRPTLIVGSVPFHPETVARILTIPAQFLALNPRSLADIESDVRTLARITNRSAHGRRVIVRMRREFARIRLLAPKFFPPSTYLFRSLAQSSDQFPALGCGVDRALWRQNGSQGRRAYLR